MREERKVGLPRSLENYRFIKLRENLCSKLIHSRDSTILLVTCIFVWTSTFYPAESAAPIVKTTSTTCGSTTVLVKTLFRKVDDITAEAVSQRIDFIKNNAVFNTFLFNYIHSYSRSSMIYQFSCRDSPDRHVLVFESTNFGNCDKCEWSDYFDSGGIYLGSTRKKFGAINFAYHFIEPALLNSILRIPYDNNSKVEISRTLP